MLKRNIIFGVSIVLMVVGLYFFYTYRVPDGIATKGMSDNINSITGLVTAIAGLITAVANFIHIKKTLKKENQ